ncbi:HGxxPAAW family protein [Streptomyces sp. NPDC088147]|uniref:HGxxPAAW family protein n=1 Tax=unclassified Streptomyces TaxID=2593676 RepID=UPI00381565DE
MAGTSHGHTPAAWTGVTISFIGFCISGVFMVAANQPGFWAGIGVVLLGGVVGLAMKAAGLGMPKESAAMAEARAAAVRQQLENAAAAETRVRPEAQGQAQAQTQTV